MKPIVDGLEAEFAGKVAVYRLDAAAQENLALQEAYGVRGHPTLVVLDANGRVAARFVGVVAAEVVRAALGAADGSG